MIKKNTRYMEIIVQLKKKMIRKQKDNSIKYETSFKKPK